MALRCTVDPRGLQVNPHNIAVSRGGAPPHPHPLQTCLAPLCPSHSMCFTNHQPSSSRPPALLPLHHHMARPIYRPPCSSIPNDPRMEFHPHLGPPPTSYRCLSLTLDAMVRPHLSNARPHWAPPPTQPTIAPNQGQLQSGPGLSRPPLRFRS